MGKFIERWNWTERSFAGLLGLITTFLAFANTVMRYVFSYSPEWMEEIVIYLIVWAAFVIASTLVEERRHVGATFLVDLLPPGMHRVVEVLTSLLALSFCILVLLLGYKIVYISYLTDERSMSGVRFPLWMFHLALPVGLTLITARYGRRIYRLLFRFSPSLLRESHESSRSAHERQDGEPFPMHPGGPK
ncbi:MAG: TRAP transporter small permease [Desulfobacterales bacterium]|nr:TRAP transporter small permease [Desulfobacterales bacterium]